MDCEVFKRYAMLCSTALFCMGSVADHAAMHYFGDGPIPLNQLTQFMLQSLASARLAAGETRGTLADC